MLKIFQLADIHFGMEDTKALACFEQQYQKEQPDLMLICGDLTQKGKRTEFEMARAWLDKFSCPKLITPGNHDTPMLNAYSRITNAFERYKDYFGATQQQHIDDVSYISSLNTARGWQARANWAEGRVKLKDLDSIIHSESAKSKNFRAIICHHPFRQPRHQRMKTKTHRGELAHRMMCASEVNLLFCGHVHNPSINEWENEKGFYTAISSGTLSTRTRNAPPSFNMIEVTEAGANVSIVPCVINQSLGKITQEIRI